MNNALQSALSDFMVSGDSPLDFYTFLVNFLVTVALSIAIGFMYKRFGSTFSNRSMFSRNFVLIAVTTMFIISIVKASLALSLGLVGALSIVRFRTSIKDPEELSYLFVCISVGLGCGANQIKITVFATTLILLYIFCSSFFADRKRKSYNLYLTIKSQKDSNECFEDFLVKLSGFCESLQLKRFSSHPESNETSLQVNCKSLTKFNELKTCLDSSSHVEQFSFIDGSGMSV